MAKLSALYVVRNEEGFIKKSLDSVVAIADEIVVVDSGSRDKTAAIARSVPKVRLYAHAWIHDFSKTKNYGIRQCSGDWVLSIDADEMLDPKSAAARRAAADHARGNIAGFGVHIVDHPTTWDPNAPSNDSSFFPSPQVRLFRKHDAIIFEGRVGETVFNSAVKCGAIDVLDASLHHFLWRGKGDEFKASRLHYYSKLGSGIPIPAQPQLPPAAPSQTAIVIPAFNALELTKECVASVQANTKSNYAFCFVNDGSSDGTNSYFASVTGMDPVRTRSNSGVAKAKNAGAKEALANSSVKFVCFLDNDAKVPDGWLEGMAEILDRNERVAMVGPLSPTADGAQHFDGGDLKGRVPEFILADSVGGFCMLVKADALRKVGLFDEGFGPYGSEAEDLCERVRQAGYEIAIANRICVEHKGKGTVMANRLDWNRLSTQAGIHFAKKWKEKRAAPQGPRSPFPNVPPPIKPVASIVILGYNRLDMTRACIDSILASTPQPFELVFVDNGSVDGTPDWVQNRIKAAKVIRNKENVGIPRGRNQGIKATTADLIVVMDNDVEVRPGWLDDLIAETRNADAAGIEAWQIDRNFNASWKCVRQGERFDYIGGACTIFKRKVFEVAGLLDEGFGMAYYEDALVSIKARQAGFKLAWSQTQKISHKQHATLLHGQKDFVWQDAMRKSQVRFAAIMRKEIAVNLEMLPPLSAMPSSCPQAVPAVPASAIPVPELPPAPKRLRILYLGMSYDYGLPERGASFEHCNFFPSIQQWHRTAAMEHFDFAQLARQHGVHRMSEMLYEKVQQFCPDALFGIWFNADYDPQKDVIRKISQTTPCKTIGWFCDSHFRYDSFDKPWSGFLDFCVTTSQSAFGRYQHDGLGKKAIKSQWGASPTYMRMDGLPLDIEVSFVGQPHGDRRSVIDRIKRAGINVQTYGTGWERHITHGEMLNVFNRSRINLNLNNAADATYKQIKGRNFEVPACGGFLLTGVAENLGDYYKLGSEVETYNSTDEMINKIRHYLGREEDRKRIAEAGYQRTVKDHSYSSRYDAIFKATGLI